MKTKTTIFMEVLHMLTLSQVAIVLVLVLVFADMNNRRKD